MIKCECGVEKFGPVEAKNFLGISAVALNKYRKEGWLRASDYFMTGYLYTREALEECARELKRRNTEVEYITMYPAPKSGAPVAPIGRGKGRMGPHFNSQV